jgi:hypothetical protein
MVGRLERNEREITLAVAHTCHMLFNVSPRDMFPLFFAGVEDNVYRRLCELEGRLLRDLPTPTVTAKLELIYETIRRLAVLKQQET